MAPNLNQSNISGLNVTNTQNPKDKNSTPFFKDMKAKNQGSSKLQMPEFSPEDINQQEESKDEERESQQ